MPLNEATGRKRPAMTPQQIREAERAIFGPPALEGAAGGPADLTHAEIEKMRQLVNAHDREHNKIETIDINNPPKEPYQYREYPRMLYLNGDRDQFIVVQNASQAEIAMSRGYLTEIEDQDEDQSDVPAGEDDNGEGEGEDDQLAGISFQSPSHGGPNLEPALDPSIQAADKPNKRKR